MLENYPALLITKLFTPRVRSGQIRRPHLLSVIESAGSRKLIVIAAAAGFGKTSLMAEWSQQHEDQVAWLSLDQGDNDPIRFLSYLIAALQTRHPRIGTELLAALQSSQPPSLMNVLPILLNQVAALPGKIFLVLDDYHTVENRDIHSFLQFLLDQLPPQLTLVLLTRSDPPLLLGRLRANGDLLELRAANLRFSIEETSSFLNGVMHLNLHEETTRTLEARTEGWIVGLQLAAIALQNQHDDGEKFVRDFTGSHHFILDYLVEEVLAHQPEPIRHFLLQTSILERLNTSLCAEVMADMQDNQGHGQSTLEYLDRHNIFLVPLDQARQWYRYHHLFADLLRARLQIENPAIVPTLYQRAAYWHETHNLPDSAVHYALLAKDFAYAAQLIIGPARAVTSRGEVITLLDWYKHFPTAVLIQKPELCSFFGAAFALAGHWSEAETLLGYIDSLHAKEPNFILSGEYLMLVYLVASFHQDSQRLAELMALAQDHPKPDLTTRLVLGMLHSLTGDLRKACQLLEDVRMASENSGDTSLALTALFQECRLRVFRGDFRYAVDLSHMALRKINSSGQISASMAVFAHVSLGRIYIEWNELEPATMHLKEAIQLGQRTGFVTGILSSATMMLAEVMQAEGNSDAATQTAQEAIRLAERYDPAPEVAWLTVYLARILITQGKVTLAQEALQELTALIQKNELPVSLFYPDIIFQVTQARLWIAQRKVSEALNLLTQLNAHPRNMLSVEILALLALARRAQGDIVHSGLALEQALQLAESENRVRVFLDLNTPMAKLLDGYSAIHPESSVFVRRLLSLFPVENAIQPEIDVLNERELEILRLIVAGFSNDEIARTLTLALSTVKWYINALYAKLQVKTRSQAIARAHELHLIK